MIQTRGCANPRHCFNSTHRSPDKFKSIVLHQFHASHGLNNSVHHLARSPANRHASYSSRSSIKHSESRIYIHLSQARRIRSPIDNCTTRLRVTPEPRVVRDIRLRIKPWKYSTQKGFLLRLSTGAIELRLSALSRGKGRELTSVIQRFNDPATAFA